MDPLQFDSPRATQDAQAHARALSAFGGRLLQVRCRPQDPAAVAVALYASPAGELRVPALAVSRLTILLTPARINGGVQDERAQAYVAARYAVFLVPAGAAANWRLDAPARFLSLSFDAPALAASGIRGEGFAAGDAPLLNATVPGIRALVDELLLELDTGAPWSAEVTDSLGRLLLVRVARQQARRRVGANPLTPQAMAQLRAYMLANLSERILVGDLAAVVGLSTNRFAHAYAQRTGQSPHQAVMDLRLGQAQALLRDEGMPLAEVAAACGFASQQHLTQVMRRRLDVTPARYRRERGAGGRTALLHAPLGQAAA